MSLNETSVMRTAGCHDPHLLLGCVGSKRRTISLFAFGLSDGKRETRQFDAVLSNKGKAIAQRAR